jgi:selenide,water dikinase
MDCSVVPLAKHPGLYLVSTTDFFYPSVDDPYYQGKIGAANVLSDLYSMGITECDTMLMLLASCNQMNERERNIVSRQLILGFNDLAREAGTRVTGGQTVLNPWPIVGGVAMAVVTRSDFIDPTKAQAGDVLILTKALGTQVAVNAHQWMNTNPSRWEEIASVVTRDDVIKGYEYAMWLMSRLNRNAAKLMHKYGAHAATDVTGFGLLGHARNLANHQEDKSLVFRIHTLPIIDKMDVIESRVKRFNLFQGFSAETSGGLLISMPKEKAEAFCKELEALDNAPAWIIGDVVSEKEHKDERANIVENPHILRVQPLYTLTPPPRDTVIFT